MGVHYLPVTWEEYHILAQKLAATILAHSKTPYDCIIAIARGGLSLGLILSDFLRIPVSTIVIQSYTDIQTQGEVTITGKLQTSIRGKRVLLVDDISDSGRTFVRALRYLRRCRPKSVTSVALYLKPHSSFRPDFFAQQTSLWILLPHEVTEWISTFTNKMEEEGKSKANIQKFLESMGYTDEQIAFVRKHYVT